MASCYYWMVLVFVIILSAILAQNLVPKEYFDGECHGGIVELQDADAEVIQSSWGNTTYLFEMKFIACKSCIKTQIKVHQKFSEKLYYLSYLDPKNTWIPISVGSVLPGGIIRLDIQEKEWLIGTNRFRIEIQESMQPNAVSTEAFTLKRDDTTMMTPLTIAIDKSTIKDVVFFTLDNRPVDVVDSYDIENNQLIVLFKLGRTEDISGYIKITLNETTD